MSRTRGAVSTEQSEALFRGSLDLSGSMSLAVAYVTRRAECRSELNSAVVLALRLGDGANELRELGCGCFAHDGTKAVSYTHLTLPTILLV